MIKHTPELIQAAESILKAKGTCLKNYMPRSQEEILTAVDKVIKEAQADLLDDLKNILNGIETGAITSDHDETFANAIKQARETVNKATGG